MQAIAVSTLKRSSLLPDLPAIAETYPGYEVNSWYGVMAPAGTPREIVTRLHKEIALVLQDPEVVEVLKKGGLDAEGTTPEQYAAKIKGRSGALGGRGQGNFHVDQIGVADVLPHDALTGWTA
ncbi:MAG: hypothetical protein IPM02_01980 [Betaproteobacteria bacterium]|nr:hypothetical protein [Betaproteobacteria bacterium]